MHNLTLLIIVVLKQRHQYIKKGKHISYVVKFWAIPMLTYSGAPRLISACLFSLSQQLHTSLHKSKTSYCSSIHSMARANLKKKVNTSQLLLPQNQSTYPRGPESASIENPPFQTSLYKIFKNCFLFSKSLFSVCSHL